MRYFSKYLLSFATIVFALCSAGIVNAQTIEFGLGDRSGKAWGIGTEKDNFIIINSSASVPGFATQENVNAFAGADLSEPLQLRLTVVHNNANPLVQILIKTPGHTAKYFADISAYTGTGSNNTPTVSTTTALGSPAEGSLGDLSAVEYIEVKGAWTSNTVRTHIRPRELTAPLPTIELSTIEFGLGDRSGKAWGIGTEKDNFIIINSSASVPGFATQENVNAFAGAKLSEPLQLRLTVVHNNANPLVQILIKTPGHSAKYFADISAYTGTGSNSTPTVSTTTALGSPAEGSLGDLSAVEYIEVKGAWTSSTVRTHIRPRELTAVIGSGGSVVTSGTRFSNPNADALGFNYMDTVTLNSIPFEWVVTGGGPNNKYYGQGSAADGVSNDTNLTMTLDGINSSSHDVVFNHTPIKFGSNTHRAGSDLLGDFRIKCQWSHFAYDDPIVFSSAPEPDQSHLHMFWGNTAVDWSTDLVDKNSPDHITAKGGSSCNGGALNRSSYWMPALMHNNDQVMTPKEILVYYKTWEKPASEIPGGGSNTDGEQPHVPRDTNRMPQGLQLIAGNGNVPEGSFLPNAADNARNLNQRLRDGNGLHGTSENIYWACGNSDGTNVKFNRIPTHAEWKANCQADWYLNATIYFPQCMQNENETRSGHPHRHHVADSVAPDRGCPNETYSHRIPRLGYLLYWDVKHIVAAQDANPGSPISIDNLRLSSDPQTYDADGVNRELVNQDRYRGGTLHADWVAAWHDSVMDMWIDHCVKDGANCSTGQLGTGIALRDHPKDYGGKYGFLDANQQVTSPQLDNYMEPAPHGSSIASMSGM